MWRWIRSSTGIAPPGLGARRSYHSGAVALAAIGVIQVLAVPPKNNLPLAYIAAVAVGAAVWYLPTRTVRAAWGVAIAVATMAFAIGTPVLVTYAGAMAAIFALSRWFEWRQVWSGYLAIIAATASVAIPVNSTGQADVMDAAYPVIYLGGAWLVGWLSRQGAAFMQMLRNCAAALERDRSQQAALAAAAERTRIARELHDVISNRVGLMVVQAEAASEVLTRRPEQAAIALDGIGVAGRQAINDLRQMLGVLRDPTSTLDVADLVEPARAAGLTVELVQEGDDQGVHSQVRSAVYRIVKDALTNTLRQATATHVRVAVHYGVTSVDLEVVDNGAAVTKTDGTFELGNGLTGVREHVREVNGEVSIGGRTDGQGLRVWASLPTVGRAGRTEATATVRG